MAYLMRSGAEFKCKRNEFMHSVAYTTSEQCRSCKTFSVVCSSPLKTLLDYNFLLLVPI